MSEPSTAAMAFERITTKPARMQGRGGPASATPV